MYQYNQNFLIQAFLMRSFIGKLVLVCVLVLLLILVGVGSYLFFILPSARHTNTTNPIRMENAKAGSTGWQVNESHMASTQIQAYVSDRSVAPGGKLTFFVSTQKARTGYSIDIYRMGWYGGKGGRLMLTIPSQVGQAQGYFDEAHLRLVACTTCYIDKTTGLIEARWQPSYTLTIPADWITGVYLVKLIDANGMQTYTSFEVTGNSTATYAVVTADTTYAAYNNWGGHSLYDTDGPPGTGTKVSFDRPSTQQYGSDQVLVFEADAIHWLERNGYDLSYMSSIDLHSHPDSLLQHKAYISLGHDEYWTKEMRDGVEHARDAGIGLLFTEANASYWQIRFEPNSAGVPNHTVVCYKVLSYHHDLARDPYYGHDNSRVTSQWRDPVVNRPENALIGVMFSDLTHKQKGFAWTVNASNLPQLATDSGLMPGETYSCGLVGYEWDKLFDNGATPTDIQVIATSKTINDTGQPDSSNTTVYIAHSGAMVFATGAVYWTKALDSYRYDPDPHCGGAAPVVPAMQQLMSNVMSQIIVEH